MSVGGAARRCEQCQCRLSRYNVDALCAACARSQREGEHVAPTVPQRVWRDADVREAFAAWDFGRASRLIRQRGPLRQEDVAHLTGLSQAFLSMLESGNRRLTNIDKIIEFLRGLDVPGELVPLPVPRRVEAARAQPSTDLLAGDLDPTLPWTAARMVSALGAAVGGSAMDRRKFMTVSGLGLTAIVHQWGVDEAEPLVRAAEGSHLSPELLDSLQQTTDGLRTMDASSGSGTLADLGSAHLSLLKRLVQQGAYDEPTGRRLAAVIADTATQTGWFTFDSGNHQGTLAYLLAALRAAKASGDLRLGAGALSYVAIHGYSTGQPRNAVTAARAAREKIKHLGTPALEAMLLTRQARGHAKLGEREAALAALGQAADLYTNGRSEQDPHWLYWINEGEIHGQSGSCHLDLGDSKRAVASFARAREALNPTDQRTQGLFLSRAASAYIRQGDIDAGAATAHEALDLAERLQSARLNQHIGTMLNDVETLDTTSAVRELTERATMVAGRKG